VKALWLWLCAWVIYASDMFDSRHARREQRKLKNAPTYTGVRTYHYCDSPSCCERIKVKGARYCTEYCEQMAEEREEREEQNRVYQERQAVKRAAEAAAFQLTQHDEATGTKRTKKEALEFHSYDEAESKTTTSTPGKWE